MTQPTASNTRKHQKAWGSRLKRMSAWLLPTVAMSLVNPIAPYFLIISILSATKKVRQIIRQGMRFHALCDLRRAQARQQQLVRQQNENLRLMLQRDAKLLARVQRGIRVTQQGHPRRFFGCIEFVRQGCAPFQPLTARQLRVPRETGHAQESIQLIVVRRRRAIPGPKQRLFEGLFHPIRYAKNLVSRVFRPFYRFYTSLVKATYAAWLPGSHQCIAYAGARSDGDANTLLSPPPFLP